jgi:AraC-like DNA-binding protein
MASAPTRVERSAVHVLEEPRDDVLLTVLRRGTASVSTGDHHLRLVTRGDADMCWAARPYVLSCTAAETVTVRLPRALVEMSDHELTTSHAQRVDRRDPDMTTFLTLLTRTLRDDWKGAHQERSIENAMAALLTAVLLSRDTGQLGDLDEELFRRACRVLRDHATEPGLTLDAVAMTVGSSRRKMELVFAARGTSPARYRRRLQLNRARDLLGGPAGHVLISTLAHDVGFSDATAFIRAFRREFGSTPGAWRASRVGSREA